MSITVTSVSPGSGDVAGGTPVTVSGSGFAGPQVGFSLLFDGSSGYVSTGATGLPTGGGARTLLAWFYITTSGGTVFSLGTGGGQQFIVFVSSFIFTDGVNGANNLTWPSNPTANTWHRLAFTLQADSTTYAVYLDGVSVVAGTFGVPINTNSNALVIGARGGSSAFFGGYISEVMIYNRALTPTEITADAAGQAADATGLSGRWLFDEGAGTTTVDGSGNGNTGTLHGGVTWSTSIPSALAFGGPGGGVDFGGAAATGVTVVDAGTITCTTPAHTAGAVTVTVTNPDATTGSLANAYTFTGGAVASAYWEDTMLIQEGATPTIIVPYYPGSLGTAGSSVVLAKAGTAGSLAGTFTDQTSSSNHYGKVALAAGDTDTLGDLVVYVLDAGGAVIGHRGCLVVEWNPQTVFDTFGNLGGGVIGDVHGDLVGNVNGSVGSVGVVTGDVLGRVIGDSVRAFVGLGVQADVEAVTGNTNAATTLGSVLLALGLHPTDSSSTTTHVVIDVADGVDRYTNQAVLFLTGAEAGIFRRVSGYSYDGPNNQATLTLDAALPSAPGAGDYLAVVGLAQGTGTPPTAAQIATAIFTDTTSSDFTVSGSPGKILVGQLGGTFTTAASSVFSAAALANAIGTDPLTHTVPGTYASGTAGAALGRIGSAEIVTSSPVAQNGAFSVTQGCDYYAADNRSFDFTDASAGWPNLTGAGSVTMYVFSGNVSVPYTMSVVTAGGSSQKVRLELSAAQSATWPLGKLPFLIIAVLASGHKVELATGYATGSRF